MEKMQAGRKKAVPVGYDDFSEVIEKNLYYVDKTQMIRDLLDVGSKVSLFTRPRRFGKTLNMSMLRYFFENGWDIRGEKMEYRHLFEGLQIAACGEEYMQHQGRYPVIFLTLKGAKQDTWEESYDAIKEQIASEFQRHSFILEDERLAKQKERYVLLMSGKAEKTSYNTSIAFLSQCLFVYFGEKTVILIDEYDVPLETAYFNGFYDRMVGFIRSLFESALKTSPYLNLAVLTGCLRVSRESIFTGMNNFRIYSILNDSFSEYFGFTNAEVEALCAYYDMTEKYEVIKEWYNGYLFGHVNVYNPWSVILQIAEYCANRDALPISHWANSSSNSIVRELIDRADTDTRRELERIIHGEHLEKKIHEDITYDEVRKSTENLWNFMFFTGYFKMISVRMEGVARYVELALPNKEVKYIFEEKITNWFQDEIVAGDRSILLEAFLKADVDTFQKELNGVLGRCISYHDYYENFYHGVLTGILSGIDGYTLRSNRENGRGRSDLTVKPLSIFETAYVIEIKLAKNGRELRKKAEEALSQIAEKEYDTPLLQEGYPKVVRYGIAFYEKSCLVKVEEVQMDEPEI